MATSLSIDLKFALHTRASAEHICRYDRWSHRQYIGKDEHETYASRAVLQSRHELLAHAI